MKKLFASMLFLSLFIASNCFAVTFSWIEVISDTRASEWRFSTDLLLSPGYSPLYEVSFSIDDGDSQPMNYLFFGVDVYDSGLLGTPTEFEGSDFSWKVKDAPNEINASATIPPGVARQVALSTITAISGDPEYPTFYWTNPEGAEGGESPSIGYYRLRVVDAIDPTKLLFQANIAPAKSAHYTFLSTNPFKFESGVAYLIRIEARSESKFPVTGDVPLGFQGNFLNRSTVYMRYGIPFPIEIDIKPGSSPNSINLKSKGVVPVAVLTTDDFDALSIDPYTVLFAGASAAHWTVCDVDNDGDWDMLFHFRTQELNIDEDSTEASLTCISEGFYYGGSDSVRTVPAPKKK